MTQPDQSLVVLEERASALPTADRLARGDEARYLFGQKLPHKLKAAEWPIYEAAKERGYLVTPSLGLARVRLRNCYWHYCTDLSRPFVVTELRQRWASIEMDLIEIPPRVGDREVSWKLSDRAYSQIDALFAEHTKPGPGGQAGMCLSTAAPSRSPSHPGWLSASSRLPARICEMDDEGTHTAAQRPADACTGHFRLSARATRLLCAGDTA